MGKEVVVYLSNEKIRVIVGSNDHKDMIKINEYFQIPFSEGSMINGVITDDNEVKNAIEEITKKGITKINLVIDSGQILVKAASVPKMKPSQLLQFVQDELSTLEGSSEDLVYDYAYLGEDSVNKNAKKILCCGVERKLLTSYIDLFKECGIEIKAIDFSINTLSKLTQELPDFIDKTYVVSLIDGNNMLSVLFENNNYKLSYRSRIMSLRDTVGFTSEILDNISHIFQFSSSSNKESVIKEVVFCGLEEIEENEIFTGIESGLGIVAKKFPTSSAIYTEKSIQTDPFLLDEYILPVGFLIRK